ncbi:cache domain-containing sensor histidine kinase [Gorillibacterium sp. sgz5001074]|uniref:cache domain-containing sensor histidine kinase n=1 Tax=Gorillibacterium sp. sgz5001074 TaxID=3446695 RepID=UPI003F6780BD
MFRLNLRTKLILILLLTLIPSIFSVFATYSLTKDTLVKKAITENSNLLAQGSMNMSHHMREIYQSTMSVYALPTLQQYVIQEKTGYEAYTSILAALQGTRINTPQIYQMYLYREADQYAYVVNRLTQTVQETAFQVPVFHRPDFYTEVEPPHLAHDYGLNLLTTEVDKPLVFSVHMPIYNLPNTRMLGYFSVDVSLDGIRSIADPLLSGEQNRVSIFDQKGTLYYDSERELQAGDRVKDEWLSMLGSRKDSRGYMEWKDSHFSGLLFYERNRKDFLDWTLVKMVSYQALYKDARHTAELVGWISFILHLVIITATLYLSNRHFTKPIARLIQVIRSVKSGDVLTPIDSPVKPNDELSLLAHHFKQMMDRIQDLILKEYHLKLANTSNQLKALHAQIHPHFINNALQTIGTTALDHDAKPVYDLISKLGQMMQYHMDLEENDVPLRKEIEHIANYLLLQEHRFEDKLQVEYELDEAALDIRVPKMILQPLVENCFKHGYLGDGIPGTIRIVCRLMNHGLVLSVIDSGKGLSEIKRLELQHLLGQETTPQIGMKQNIGLMNVCSRLRLFFGNEVTVRLEHHIPSGLEVTLMIPVSGKENIA